MIGSKIEGLDTIRAAAIILIVLDHVVELTFSFHNPDAFSQMQSSLRFALFFVFTLGRLGVDLFFFLTGYLLLPRVFDPPATEKFYRRNFLSLLVTWELWIVLYNLFIGWLDASNFQANVPPESHFFFVPKPLEIDTLIRNMIFVEAVGLVHAWYLAAILGIYIFLPIVARALGTLSNRELLTLTAIAFIYYFIVPSVDHFTECKLETWISLSFSGEIFGIYVVLGYIIRRFEPTLIAWRYPLIVFSIAAIALTAQIQIDAFKHGEVYLVWHDFCLLPLASIGLFVGLKSWAATNRLIEVPARYSFGIYLLHAPILMWLLRFNPFPTLERGATVVIWFLLIMALSSAAIKIFGAAPALQRILFRVR